MVSYHIDINTGGKGEAAEHAQYIAREGRFTEAKYGAIEAKGHANFPAWAREDMGAFWRASDEHERANGNTYRELELALPRELSSEARIALVERFAEQELGTTRVYQWAIHTGTASDGGEQPHVHLMFSDRQLDGIERGAEQFFKRYNSKTPERGGSRKYSYGATKAEAALAYKGIRERWASVQNQALERAGVEARVDHRSLADQGIVDREPGIHRGPAVSGIEARGEVSQVGERQREQREARALEREAVVADVRVVTREEMALERVAVRERRELAQEATGEDRGLVLSCVEGDRREQLGRVEAQVEWRIERRSGLDMGELRETLLSQARALRERVGWEIGRVKAWVVERFPEPLRQLTEQTRELFGTVAQKARRKETGMDARAAKPTLSELRAEGRREWLQERARQAAEQKPLTLEEMRRQGREEWLKIRAERVREETRAAAASIDRSSSWGGQPDEPLGAESERSQQALEAERREASRQAALEQQREQERAKVLAKERGLGLGDDGFDIEF